MKIKTLEEFEKNYKTKTEAAEALGISEKNYHRFLNKDYLLINGELFKRTRYKIHTKPHTKENE